ncbi:hypothetical protein EDC04DRAFT_2575544 [Pisolithus marmoratus]|nr:hypothetical protein EDC04DRAFT_2575544 [Pisolithus marmoratus]
MPFPPNAAQPAPQCLVTPNPSSTCGVSLDSEPSSYLHPSACLDPPPLKHIRQLIADWQSKWGAESTWPMRFHKQLKHAQGRGQLATDLFFSQCEAHVEEGRWLIWLLRSITCKGFRSVGHKAADSYEQVFDLLTSLLSELCFFKVKLDDYAPISPLSQIFEARYYITM